MSPQTEKQSLLILGAGVFAEEIASLAKDTGRYDVYGFVEGVDRNQCKRQIQDKPIIWIDDIDTISGAVVAVCSVGSPKRRNFIKQAASSGIQFIPLVHPSVQLSRGCNLGAGTIVCAGSIIAAETSVGQHVLINRGCLIGHHMTIGDYATISPGVNIAGKVRIGEGAYIGMGAIILDGISIGKHSIIGAGALVTRDVPDQVMVMGLPAKTVKTLKVEE